MRPLPRRLAGVALGALALSAAAALAGATEAPLTLGERLPTLRGERLDGRAVALPDSSLGAPVLLLLGFSYESRHDVDAWADRLRRDAGTVGRLACFEVPVIGGAARLARPFIDRGMRRGTPRELHGRVVTVYHDAGVWKRRVGYDESSVAYLLLLDHEGRLTCRMQGPFTEPGYQTLAGEIRRLSPTR